MIKKENDELTQLFCTHHLEKAEITPRDGFWESIQNDVSLGERRRRKLLFYRTVSAASVLLIIGAASAAFFFIPKNDNTNQIIAKVAASMSRNIPSKQRLEIEPKQAPSAAIQVKSRMTSNNRSGSAKEQQPTEGDNDSTVTVTVHMTVRVRDNENYADNTLDNRNNNNTWQAGGLGSNTDNNTRAMDKLIATNNNSNKRWALKAALNLTMPASGVFEIPAGGSITLEKQLNDWLALESGIKYTYMHSDVQTLHYLSIPVKVNATLAKLSKVDIYATAGGSADKCIAATHSAANENIQFTAMAGVGIRYRLNNKIAVFAEPTITHYFNNESKYTSYRTEKSNAFNLQSGLCMNF